MGNTAMEDTEKNICKSKKISFSLFGVELITV